MLKRVITGIVALGILIPVLIFSDQFIFPAAVATIAAVAVFEMLKCLKMHKKLYLAIPAYIIAAVMPFLLRYINSYSISFTIGFIVAVFMLFVVFVCVIWSHGKLPFADAMSAYVLIAYIIIAMCSVVYVRDYSEAGRFTYLLIFFGAWMTDVFAYFTGVLFGRHKLIEDVSPKKTIEGSIGGIFFCTLSFVLIGLITNKFFDTNANYIFLGISGAIVSVVSQIGDLIMSVIKRHYGIKDYGKIFPGHGGVIDRFDSVLMVSLAMAAICMVSQLISVSLF